MALDLQTTPSSDLLASRTALVTGASGGIGRVIATTLAAHGARVVLASRRQDGLDETARLIRAAGGFAEVRMVDVLRADEISDLAAALASDHLEPDVLVNNSGLSGPSKVLWEIEPEEWDETMAVNVRGVFLCCRAFVPRMVARGEGSVINIGSVTGKNPLAHRSPYATSKAALIGLTKTLAADAGPSGVRVNLVSPGAVWGDRLDWVIRQQAEVLGQPVDAVRTAGAGQAALRRFTEATEVAEAVAFLASDRASGITGIDLTVAAGMTMN